MKDECIRNGATPKEYKCQSCGADNCKLWREYNISYTDLLCCDCAGKSQNKDVSQIDGRGRTPGNGDQIGFMVPAVPKQDGIGFWGYSFVPKEGCDWWYQLPTRSKSKLA